MKKNPQPLRILSLRNLAGGQFGTLDVSAVGPTTVQIALGNDFVNLSIHQWMALRHAVDRTFVDAHGGTSVAAGGGAPPPYEPVEYNEGGEQVTVTPVVPRSVPQRERSTSASRTRRPAKTVRAR